MGSTNLKLPGLVPPLAAPALSEYEQFSECAVPSGSGAVRALIGFIRPFSDDQTAIEVLRAIEAQQELHDVGGRLNVLHPNVKPNTAEPFLTHMAVPFSILVVEFDGTEHRRAFLLDPKLQPRLSLNPHFRADKGIRIEGEYFPALCVYSGNIFKYDTQSEPLLQFLDQTATYLAKHLIWLRTRMLWRDLGNGFRKIVRRRVPTEPVDSMELLLESNVYWDGYWPGEWAPTGPAQHLRTVDPNGECWCWSGRLYKHCHMNREKCRVYKGL